ncbi:uncharacterized protein LOC120696225 [Panicum virgatum]|uniref:Phorbol-ester/DAG-type domain-containing protein n=1 Tax=Panicum virgatum TaxID=38727 RepID=A0A8T0WNQ9_PANVG|nr:uncharacterized protein LOC120696225 [Panicum virgatum]KAG2646754.1 hypothetical protein PVAP13_2KG528500 [Panicum virgatum]
MTAAASATSTIRSTYYHPQHMLTSYHYTAASTHPCAACERVVTGAGYSCDECDFNIHKACFTGLPGSICLGRQSDQGLAFTLALTRLAAARACGLCEETSRAGRYMYLCAPMELYLHPRCVLLTAGTHFHPEHLLSVYCYDGAGAAYACAACERAITGGVGFRCGECDFSIHEACLGLPASISLAQHSREHGLTLTRLKASRWCDVCRETSHAGCYMYLCAPCNYDVHPRCVPAADDGGAQRPRAQQQPQRGGQVVQPNRGGRGDAARAVQTGLHVVSGVAHTADSVCTLVNTLASAGACMIM